MYGKYAQNIEATTAALDFTLIYLKSCRCHLNNRILLAGANPCNEL
jgi:hypothetical protein